MALSLTAPIVYDDIQEIVLLKPLKVFLLRGYAGDEIVIKADAVQAGHVKSAGVVVKAIDPGVKMKVLTPPEILELRNYVELYLAVMDVMGAVIVTDPERAAIDSLRQLFAMPGNVTMMKMNKQTLQDLGEAFNMRSQGDKGPVKQFITALKSPGGLEKLGQVIAADMYNGNTDRFCPLEPGVPPMPPLSAGSLSVQLKVVVNPGNVMIIVGPTGVFSASLLDYVDPQSQFKDSTHTLANQEAGQVWPGRTLIDKTARHAFAKDVIEDLEKILHPKKHKLSLKTKLGSDAVKRLEAGMLEAVKLIKRALEVKYNPAKWNSVPSVRDRYQLLCQIK